MERIDYEFIYYVKYNKYFLLHEVVRQPVHYRADKRSRVQLVEYKANYDNTGCALSGIFKTYDEMINHFNKLKSNKKY